MNNVTPFSKHSIDVVRAVAHKEQEVSGSIPGWSIEMSVDVEHIIYISIFIIILMSK